MGRVDGKVILVTGGASGIGRGISDVLAREGAAVVIAARNQERGAAAEREIREQGGEALFVKTDQTVEAECAALVDTAVARYGKLTGLVNNAGIFPRSTLEETTSELWDQIFAVNLKGPFFCCKYAVPALRANGGGSIVNIGSANSYIGAPNLFAYSVSKGGLVTLTRNLANSLAKDRIRVNFLNPGWVITEMEVEIQAKEGHDEAWIEEAARRMPLGRHQVPEDAAYACLYLLSDEANQVSGDLLNVDGRGLR
ncbi:MAG: glucose 1-dehydrogenase [Armatimonadetes bacterium]|nr:glucose 1-dehydrogenase [Armatimonadota bacterium]